MRALIVLTIAFWAQASIAHPIDATNASGSGEWLLIGLLLLSGVWYAVGYFRVHAVSGAGRARLHRQGLMFGLGWAVIAASLLSPLHELGGQSFTAHMIEHELLMLIAAPLMTWSKPLGILLWAFPTNLRHALGEFSQGAGYRRRWSGISSPMSASLLQAVMLWMWHAPALFNAALLSSGWHVAQHLCLFGSALLFWWSMNRASSLDQRHGVAAFWLFFTSLHSGLLGALMSFSQSPWYPKYAAMALAGAGGLTPLEDQQLAGLIMWIPGGAFHAIVALVYLNRWLQIPWQGLEVRERST
ncbi:MAG: cytochrome c oxidase assembly protein [Povalibacter sp.]